jgi:hypothetical protein
MEGNTLHHFVQHGKNSDCADFEPSAWLPAALKGLLA